VTARILIAVTHLLGIGHLVRARQLAQALVRAGHEVTLASGGLPDGAPEAGYRVEQLPPLRIEGTDFRRLLDERGEPAAAERLSARRAALVALAREVVPDVVVTEHFPFGRRQLAQEFLALIAAARAARPQLRVLASIRDVLVVPSGAERVAEAHRRVAELFDAVLVHGDARLLPLDASWPVTSELAGKLVYTGYLAAAPANETAAPVTAGQGGSILVSGGGSAAALPLFEAALAAARLLPDQRFHLLVGRGVAEVAFASLCGRAPENACVERVRPDFPALLRGCALSVSLAGYNTVLDLVQARRPALLVPFDAGNETEQALRAAALARAGLAAVVGREPAALAAAIRAGLAAGPPPALAVDLDGAQGTVAAIARMLARDLPA
jgi:predicted glycosyltransferase